MIISRPAALALALVHGTALLLSGCASAPVRPLEINLVALNDFHGNLEPSKYTYTPPGSTQPRTIQAGGIYAAWVHYIDPSDVFDVLYSVKPIVMALMGGLGSPLGVVGGAFLYLGLEEVVWRNYIQIHTGVLGVLIVLLLLFLPHGLISLRPGMLFRKAKHV